MVVIRVQDVSEMLVQTSVTSSPHQNKEGSYICPQTVFDLVAPLLTQPEDFYVLVNLTF